MSFNSGRNYRYSPNYNSGSRVKPAESQPLKYEDRKKYDDLFSKESTVASKEERLDEQFRSLLDQSYRSKENIDHTNQPKSTSNRLLSTLSSPVQDFPSRTLPKSHDYTIMSPKYEDILDKNREQLSSFIKVTDYNIKKLQDDQSNKLEREIQDLKNTVLERLRRQEAETKAKENETKKASRRSKVESLSSSEDEHQAEEEIVHPASSKANPKSHRVTAAKGNVRSAKSPSRAALKKKNVKSAEVFEDNEQTLKPKLNKLEKNKYDGHETVPREKYNTLKYKAKEMRSTLQQYIEKYAELEGLLAKKDRILLEYEDQIKQSQQELLKNFEILQESKRNQEAATKSGEDLRIQNEDLKSRIHDQKKKLDDLEEQIRKNENKYHTQLESLRNEKHELKINLRDREEKLDHVTKLNEKLKDENDYLQRELEKNDAYSKKLQAQIEKSEEDLKELRDKVENLQIENKGFAAKNEELNENKTHLEDKLAKYKKKVEEEHAKWESEKEKELEIKKQKNKQLKANLNESENLLKKAIDDKKGLGLELERHLMQKTNADKELNRLREELLVAHQETKTARANIELLTNQNDELTKNYQKESDKSLNVQTEGRKLIKNLQSLEEKLALREKELAKSDELNGRLRNELRILAEENERSKEHISHLEFKLSRQEDDMNKFEAKLGELEHEILAIKDENDTLKSKQISQSKEIEAIKEERDDCKLQCKNLKQINKNLEKDLREVDERVREFILDKQTELNEYDKENAIQKQLNSKLKVLEDIQTMIRSHRHSHRN